MDYGIGVTESFAYNIQGWQTSQTVKSGTQTVFDNSLKYYDGTTPLYSGNISEWAWTQKGQTENSYRFAYDYMSRLTGADHYVGSAKVDKFTEKAIAYDKNSNLTSMTRYVNGTASNISFAYSGNHRTGYTYDNNGNISKDVANNLDITYNFLNLPTVIKQNTTVKATYTYLADGSKYKTVNASGGGFGYVGSFRYNRNNSNITLESVATAGGRTYKTSGGYEVRYFISDHLGSTRLVAYANGTVIEQNDYMPYGERHSNSVLATSTNPYLYNGKESQKDFGVNYIDSEARFQRLDGSFNSMDPLCEEKPYISPYAYCGANPIARVDTDGLDWYSYVVNDYDLDGNIVGTHTEYAYTKYKSQKELDEAGIDGIYQGEIVVVFDGFLNEQLGTKSTDPVGLYIDGDDAITANVTVYGYRGDNDINMYTGFTMSSDFSKYGAIADGEYYVNYVANGKKAPLASNYAVNNKGPVDCLYGVNPSPINPYSKTQKNAIYIHATNANGKAGGNIAASTGCLLIQGGTQWNNFKAQIGQRDFKLILNRR